MQKAFALLRGSFHCCVDMETEDCHVTRLVGPKVVTWWGRVKPGANNHEAGEAFHRSDTAWSAARHVAILLRPGSCAGITRLMPGGTTRLGAVAAPGDRPAGYRAGHRVGLRRCTGASSEKRSDGHWVEARALRRPASRSSAQRRWTLRADLCRQRTDPRGGASMSCAPPDRRERGDAPGGPETPPCTAQPG